MYDRHAEDLKIEFDKLSIYHDALIEKSKMVRNEMHEIIEELKNHAVR